MTLINKIQHKQTVKELAIRFALDFYNGKNLNKQTFKPLYRDLNLLPKSLRKELKTKYKEVFKDFD